MSGPLPLSWWSVGAAASLVLINGLLSLWLHLGLERKLLVAALRTVVQLTLMGYLLLPVFRWSHPALVLGLGLLMVILAARAAVGRIRWGYRRATLDAFVALLLSAAITVAVGTRLIVDVDPWWQPRYLLPLLGMVLGNSLTGISLGVESCLERMVQGRASVEALLAAGATRWEASLPVIQQALQTALLPILNTMTVVGMVSIPGMMTGQLLGGTLPELAARYQILIIFLVAAATGIGAVIAVLLSARAAFDDQHRLRPEQISRRR